MCSGEAHQVGVIVLQMECVCITVVSDRDSFAWTSRLIFSSTVISFIFVDSHPCRPPKLVQLLRDMFGVLVSQTYVLA